MKEPRSYWLQCLFWLIIWLVSMGVLAYPLMDFRHNVELSTAPPYKEYTLDSKGYSAIDGGSYLEPTVDTFLAWQGPKRPHCTFSHYREGGDGIAVKWAVGEGGFTAPWQRVSQTWSCSEG